MSRGGSRRMLGVVLLSCTLMTALGFLLKSPCLGHYNANRDRYLCSNDIQVLYVNRAMVDRTFPYIHGDLVKGQLVDGAIEYPVLTGLFAWLPATVTSNDSSYFVVSALLMAPFSVLSAWLLFRMARWRALLYALAPPLIWYSFHNWDLLVVAATVAAFYQWWKRRPVAAAALLAVGACLKFWPLFFLVPLAVSLLHAGDRRTALRATLAAVGTAVAINGLFVVANFKGWWAAYRFQALREADVTTNSIWYWGFPSLTRGTLNVLVPILLCVAFAGAVGYGVVRARRLDEPYPFLQVCAAMLCAYLLINKVHSPQYALWLLPFFVLVRVRLGWWVAYMALDATLYVGLFRWFYDLSRGQDFGLAKQALVIGVWGRAVMLVLLFVVFLRAQSAAEPEPRAPLALSPGADRGGTPSLRP
ncbi:MAG: glycosyltransferase 87 family protein [Mycobacteriales bacterium]